MKPDAELLSAYARQGSEAAFAELVKRHLPLVYHAALRHTRGNGALAEEAAQAVFSDLARKAARLSAHQTLVGWLFKSAHYASAKLAREAQRRQAREQKAGEWEAMMRDEQEQVDWEKLRPVIDQVLFKLGEKDRQALLLRFFEGRSFGELGRLLGVSEDGARMRVERALERVRALLARHKITSTGAALGAALAAQATAAVPAGLASSVTGTALVGAAGSAVSFSLLALMSTTKMQVGLACLVIAAGGAGVAMQQREIEQMRRDSSEVERMKKELSDLRLETGRMERQFAQEEQWRAEAADLAVLRSAKLTTNASVAKAGASAGSEGTDDVDRRVYDVAELDVKPRATRMPPPSYPASLRFDGTQGEALISFEVSDDGSVRNVKVKSCSDTEFGEAAASSVALWQFSPGMLKGKAVPVRLSVPIVFSISEEGKKPTRGANTKP